jgi:hypothetical protein
LPRKASTITSWEQLKDALAQHVPGEPLVLSLDPSKEFSATSTVQLKDGITILGGSCATETNGVASSTTGQYTHIACDMAEDRPAFNVSYRWAIIGFWQDHTISGIAAVDAYSNI